MVALLLTAESIRFTEQPVESAWFIYFFEEIFHAPLILFYRMKIESASVKHALIYRMINFLKSRI